MAKSKEELISMIENELVDSTSQKITGTSVKNVMLAMVETMGTGGDSTMEYWSVPAEAAEEMADLVLYIPWVKFTFNSATYIMSGGAISLVTNTVLLAFAIDWSAKIAIPGVDGIKTVREVLDGMQIPSFAEIGCTPLTEEEFYTI